MFFPGMGMSKPLPPKRKAEKEMKSKFGYFLVGAVLLQLAPYISTAIVDSISTLIYGKRFNVILMM
jgi:hypothetical protein